MFFVKKSGICFACKFSAYPDDVEGVIENKMIERFERYQQPTTLDEAAHLLISDLSPEQMAVMSRLNDEQFDELCDQLVPHLEHDFRLWSGNQKLLTSCFRNLSDNSCTDPMRIIMERVRQLLQASDDVIIIT